MQLHRSYTRTSLHRMHLLSTVTSLHRMRLPYTRQACTTYIYSVQRQACTACVSQYSDKPAQQASSDVTNTAVTALQNNTHASPGTRSTQLGKFCALRRQEGMRGSVDANKAHAVYVQADGHCCQCQRRSLREKQNRLAVSCMLMVTDLCSITW